MIQFIPQDAITEASRSLVRVRKRYYTDAEWLMAYEYFARKLKTWAKDTPFEWLNATSSINNHQPREFVDGIDAAKRLSALLMHAGTSGGRGDFLRWMGIASWSDLQLPIDIKGRRPKQFPGNWFELRGRRFKRSPNSCHPKAKWVMATYISLGSDMRWSVDLEYGYPHDSSSWYFGVRQKRKEPLDSLASRFNALIAKRLVPEFDPGWRKERESYWGRVHGALRDLFWDDMKAGVLGYEELLADAMTQIPGTTLTDSRILLTRQRLATLRNWIRDTKLRARRVHTDWKRNPCLK